MWTFILVRSPVNFEHVCDAQYKLFSFLSLPYRRCSPRHRRCHFYCIFFVFVFCRHPCHCTATRRRACRNAPHNKKKKTLLLEFVAFKQIFHPSTYSTHPAPSPCLPACIQLRLDRRMRAGVRVSQETQPRDNHQCSREPAG